MSATAGSPRPNHEVRAAEVIPLRYVARAGLLPELTRQTYDSLYKALREAILNSVDAGATSVTVDLAAVETDRSLEITDDGAGMSLAEIQESFMSLGGSRKFLAADKFGRIGIGSLALMHYAEAVHIETKQAGSTLVTKAVISHPWSLDEQERAQDLSDVLAGRAWQEPSGRAKRDHSTTIRLVGVNDVLVRECADVTSYYRLVEKLRRILPLTLPDSEVYRQLSDDAPELMARIREHAATSCANVTVCSRWSNGDLLTKRVYGDGGTQEEEWDGRPKPILKDIEVDDDGRRTITVGGYLLSQVRPSSDWVGLTARVQNVAVEERTFFDLESDPGFRKYITGEVWLLGEVDRARLVNIDRASFSRESPDYGVVARAMQSEISRFKSEFVQAPRRAKVAIKRRLEQQRSLMQAARRIALAASEAACLGRSNPATFPSSNNGRIVTKRSRELVDDLTALGAVVALEDSSRFGTHPYRLRVASDGARVLVEVDAELAQPAVTLGRNRYRLQLVEGRASDPAIVVKARPREIVFNLAHDCFNGELRQTAAEVLMSLEFSYLLGSRTSEDLYDSVLSLIADRRG